MREVRYKTVRACVQDTLLQAPASSVEVEKQHANLQTDTDVKRAESKRAHTVQKDAYVMSCCLEHSSAQKAVMSESWGTAKRKVARVFRNSRLLDSSAPGGLLVRRRRINEQGHVKGHGGLLKGMLPLV